MSSDKTQHTFQNLKTLAFHKMQTSFSFGANNYSPRRFENLLKYITENDYSFISIDEIGGELKEKSILITFDDGYAHLYKYLPQFIQKYNFKPLIFIPTNQIGKSNSWDYSHIFQSCPHLNEEQIKKLAGVGVDFGSHSHHHVDLTSLTFNQLKMELKQSKDILENVIGKEVNSISYPFGRFNKHVIGESRKAGYQHGFTMKFPYDTDTSLTLGRFPIYGFDTLFSIRQKIEHRMFYHCERFKSSCTSKLSGGTVLLNKFRKK